ncbi:MAG: hypothetical protein P8R54_26420 [Myxococcota bacterium]|nr:hypothetical protein [Myxococcota bacterium]
MKKTWIRRGLIAGGLLIPGLAFAAAELAGGDATSLCSMISALLGGCPAAGG